MFQFKGKILPYWKKVTLFCSLFLSVFLLVFYLVNLDLQPVQQSTTFAAQESIDQSTSDAELSKRIKNVGQSLGNYADWAKNSELTNKKNALDADPDGDGLVNYLEFVYGTNPLKADSDGDHYTDKQEIMNGYDPDAPGAAKPLVYVEIKKINVDAPMVWTQSENESDMLNDLKNGLSHYPSSASPGQKGNAIISGHSSNYVWVKGDYNHIFKDLNNLEKGDMITIRTVQANGRIISYFYQVNDKFITTPDDDRIFAETNGPTLTLSTCWPIGTNLKRAIIKAQLVK